MEEEGKEETKEDKNIEQSPEKEKTDTPESAVCLLYTSDAADE